MGARGGTGLLQTKLSSQLGQHQQLEKRGIISQALPSSWYIVGCYAIDASPKYHGPIKEDLALKVVNIWRGCTSAEECCVGVWV